MIKTGITLRAYVGDRLQGVDLGDPRLTGEQVLRFLVELGEDDRILRTMDAVRWAFALEKDRRETLKHAPRKQRKEPDVVAQFLEETALATGGPRKPAKEA